MASSFFEGQEFKSNGCGRHAINNLLKRKAFLKEDARYNINDSNITSLQEEIPLQGLCRYLLDKYAFFEDCPDEENYDVNVLLAAFDVIGHKATSVWNKKDRVVSEHDIEQVLGYIVNLGGSHWIALRHLTSPVDENQIEVVDSLSDKRVYAKNLNAYVAVKKASIEDVLCVENKTSIVDPNIRYAEIIFEQKKARVRDTLRRNFKYVDAPITKDITINKREGGLNTTVVLFEKGTLLIDVILSKFITNAENLPAMEEVQKVFDVANEKMKTFIETLNKNVDTVAAAAAANGADDFRKFVAKLTGGGGGGGGSHGVTHREALSPGSKKILVNLVGNTFIIDIGQDAYNKRANYAKGPGSLDPEDARLLTFLGANPTNDKVKPLLAEFFTTMPQCNTDATVTMDNQCDMPMHFLWQVRELRHLSAVASMTATLITGFQLAALRAMVNQAPRMLAFARAHALVACAEAAAPAATAGTTTFDEDLDTIFTVC